MVHLINSSSGTGSTTIAASTYDQQARLICGDAGITTAAATKEYMTCGVAGCANATGAAAYLVCGTALTTITGAAAKLVCGAGLSAATGAAAYLTCGIAGSADFNNWEAITDTGKFSITINGNDYDDLNPDFTSAGSMAGVATAIQTVLNAALTGTTCTWAAGKFTITAPAAGAGSVGLMRSPGSGVDLSGFEWINGANGTPTAEVHNWKGYGTTGKFSITINGTTYNNLNPNFGSVSTMANVATAIQTVLAAALTGTTCTWSTDHFVITAPKTGVGSISALIAPGSGVDISGATLMNGVLGTATAEVKNWVGLGTSGKFSITVNGSSLANLNPNFGAVASMAEVATAIQTVLHAALAGTTCAWSTDHFVITAPESASGTIGFVVAPGSGTDIGSTFMAAKSTDGGVTYAGVKNWKGLGTTGKFTVSVDGNPCTDVNPDFSAVTSMAEVATAIETVVAAVVVGTTVTWSTDRFVITSPTAGATGVVTVLTAPGSGTDLAAAAWMNGKAGTGVVTHGLGNWEGLTNTGAFGITVDGVVIASCTPNFTGVTSMAEVATAIQTALRVSHAGTICTYDTNHFVIVSPIVGSGSTITVLSAPGAGTDIASAGYMNGKVGTVVSVSGAAVTTGYKPFFDSSVVHTTQVLKASTGVLRYLNVVNPGATDAYLQVFDVLAPTIGSTTPSLSLWVPAYGSMDATIPENGIAFSTAITYAATSTATGAVATSSPLVLNAVYE